MITIQALNKTIGAKDILRGIHLNISHGETIGILGPNGAGKSTILKIIAGLVKPSSGIVEIDSLNFKEHDLEVKKKIGFLAHNSYLYDHFSPMENLKLFGQLYKVENCEEKAKELIREVGLTFFMHEPVRSFSRGMIQRLAIARAIIHEPQILILDEPHTGLDQQAVKLLNDVILKMKDKGTTILMVTHDFAQTVKTCDRILIMKHGMIVDDFQVKERNSDYIYEKYSGQVG
ncbi:heme ABC exporter ATP-binding protein CcmA [Bacillus sp. Marseille-P3661]|uniref:heme ABC exporter ATP-binding protein CcmA n=1 Tax=Bacillus sp. Marseille-P3661 TaxID=1936234 RepID=UPI000C864FF6|nr:heme ABC exporter ATP-binding protein CcmA [Bacillus sp. Marseille-P3661]